jgi:hypothetical protein
MSILKVRAHVALAMRDAVTASTPFDRESYHEGLVPASDHPKGWEANEPNWALILKECESMLHHEHGYPRPPITVEFVKKTFKKPLSVTNDALAKAISENTPVS